MATKIQLEAMVTKILELQYYGESVHVVYFDPCHLTIHTATNKITYIDTDGKEVKSDRKYP